MLDLTVQGQRGAEASAPGEALERHASAPGLMLHGFGLAARVLAVTIGFVFLAMGLFYVTRLTAHREMWLHGKISAAQTTVEAFGLAGPTPPPQDLAQKILHSVDVKWLAVETPTERREFVLAGGPPVGAESITADDSSWLESLTATFRAVFAAPHTIAKLSAPAQGNEPAIEFAFDEQPLIHSLRRVSGNFLAISLTIAAVVTCVLWAALWRMVLWPVRRLTSNIIAFGESPQDATRVITPSGRGSEIGRAEAALAVMQRSLAHELAQGKRLAELGMAVARINHDLRNMLSAAQLISDRLAAIPDPLAQRLAPRLVATLDRAIQFCQATLTYGAARELPPLRRRFDLSELVGQVVEFGDSRKRRRDRLQHRHSAAVLRLRRPRSHAARARESEPQRRPGAVGQGRDRRTSESHPLCGHPDRRACADRGQRHRPRIPGRSERADLRAVPQIDERRRRGPWPCDRG